MNLFLTFRIAIRALTRNKLRSSLTMLGIMIGVGAVIANMGNNMLFVMSGSNNTGGMRGGAGSSNTLTPDDAAAIATDCPAVRAVSPGVRANGQLVFGNQNWIAS